VIVEVSPYWLRESGSSVEHVHEMLTAGGLVDISASEGLASTLLGPSADRHYARNG
jgi:hypothetical protein